MSQFDKMNKGMIRKEDIDSIKDDMSKDMINRSKDM